MDMDIQRLRNLTTGCLHTEMAHVYEDIGAITGEHGIMTHQLPNACRALEPYLREHLTDARFWDGEWDRERAHAGTVDVSPMDDAARDAFWQRYSELPSPFSRLGSAV